MGRVEKVRGHALVMGDCEIEGAAIVNGHLQGPTIEAVFSKLRELEERVKVLERGDTVA